jgi:hypothetical protein
MKYLCVISLILCTSAVCYGQPPLLSIEAAPLETAWTSGPRLANTSVPLLRGFHIPTTSATFENISTDATGIARMSTKRWEPIQIVLPRPLTADYMGCLMVKSKCTPLPVGSKLDKKTGIFYWHVPNAYKGEFDLVFLQPGSRLAIIRITAGVD